MSLTNSYVVYRMSGFRFKIMSAGKSASPNSGLHYAMNK